LPVTLPAQSPTPALEDTVEAWEFLQPGDLVRLRIWREPDLSGDFPVDEAGIVVFPLLGPLLVTAESPTSLKVRLAAAYQEYLRNPSIEVFPMRRVNILGSVRAPGLYPVDATMTLDDAVALAGGTTPQGDLDKVDLLRGGERIQGRLSQRTMSADLAIRSGAQLFVPERSWISRNSNIVAVSISASVSLVIALLIRR
jgi:polysaccharide export outer membrane protein